jgi:hypothetical protein
MLEGDSLAVALKAQAPNVRRRLHDGIARAIALWMSMNSTGLSDERFSGVANAVNPTRSS